MKIAAAVAVAATVGMALQPLVVRAASSRGIVDIPNRRSSHTVATPRCGGVAIMAGVLVALWNCPGFELLCLPLAGYTVLGLLEDLRGIAIGGRLVSQLVLGALTALLIAPHGITGSAVFALTVALVALWCTAFVNAFNFMDGLNGISAANSMVSGVLFGVLGVLKSDSVLIAGGFVLSAAAATFLPWNMGRAKIFLGDVGSYGIGAVLALLVAWSILHNIAVESTLAPVALYLTDTGWTLIRRMRAGEMVFQAHRSHVYQRLTDAGWSHSRVAVSTALLSVSVGICGMIGSQLGLFPRIAGDLVAVMILMFYVCLPQLLGRRVSMEVKV